MFVEISGTFWDLPGQVLRTITGRAPPTPLLRGLHDTAEAAFSARPRGSCGPVSSRTRSSRRPASSKRPASRSTTTSSMASAAATGRPVLGQPADAGLRSRHGARSEHDASWCSPTSSPATRRPACRPARWCASRRPDSSDARRTVGVPQHRSIISAGRREGPASGRGDSRLRVALGLVDLGIIEKRKNPMQRKVIVHPCGPPLELTDTPARWAILVLLIGGLAGCATAPSSRSGGPPASYMGVFTGEFVDGRPLYRFPTVEVVGSRRRATDHQTGL